MEGWIIDVRYAFRRLVRRPTYALLATLTLALGVGGTAAIFAIARGLLLDPLPVADEAKVGIFWNPYDWTEQEFTYLRGRIPGFADVAAYRPQDVTLQSEGAPTQLLPGMATSSEFFSVLGVQAFLGRGFQPGDDVPGAERVAVVSHGLWRELGGDPSLIGKVLRFDGIPRTIVGVMPEGFWFPAPNIRVWTPALINPERRSGMYAFVGRVAPDQRLDAFGPPLERLRAMLDERFDYLAQWDKLKSPKITPVREALIGPLRPALIATLTAMALTLLIACANVAALMLGQVEGRSTELAVRAALGAARGRIIRQLLAESLVVGVAAGVVGAGMAAVAFRSLTGALPLGAWGESTHLDWGVFWLAMAIALGASVLVAIIPVISIGRAELRDALGRGRTGGVAGRGGRLESGLVIAEVALAVLMTSGAALLTRSVVNLYAIDAGIDHRGVAVLDVVLGATGTTEQRQQTYRELVAAMQAIPGVVAAGGAQKLPLRGSGDNWGINVEGRPDLPDATTAYRIVTPGYFAALGFSVASGRTFDLSDRAGGESVVVINESLAKKYFPGLDPVGRRIGTGYDTTWSRIVGVVKDVAEGSLTDAAEPGRYMLAEQMPFVPSGQSLVLALPRDADPARILQPAREAIARVAPSVAVQEATTMSRVFDRAVGPVRQVMTLLALLTGLALTLGAVGVYGVISHFASRRQRDWGIRVALGLAPTKVINHVVGRGLALVGGGVALGIVGALLMARLLASLLYGVGAADPIAYGAAGLTLIAIGIVAAWLPARRASRVDPAVVLRES